MKKSEIWLEEKSILIPEKRIIVDCHEQEKCITYITDRFTEQGVAFERKPLPVGDYSRGEGSVVVERKKSIAEFAYDLSHGYQKRFRREFDTAKDLGIKIIMLIENKDISNIDDLVNIADVAYDAKTRNLYYKALYSGVDGKTLCAALHFLMKEYDVSVEFCSHMQAGNKIIEILFGDINL